MELNNALVEMKQKIEQVNQEIKLVRSRKRYSQLKKYKHRLEKEVMTYMYLRYGVEMRKEK